MKVTRKSVNLILFIIFIVFAFVQLNDPDPYIWFTLYALIGGICLFSNYKSIPKLVLITMIVLLLAYAAYHFSLFVTYLKTDHKEEIFGEMVYEKPYLEGSREFLGLLLGALALFYQLKRAKS
ncbi:hypothetical protein MHTCC0001_02260 [Flavobacteriaceae bacterium MHTCC 0001]